MLDKMLAVVAGKDLEKTAATVEAAGIGPGTVAAATVVAVAVAAVAAASYQTGIHNHFYQYSQIYFHTDWPIGYRPSDCHRQPDWSNQDWKRIHSVKPFDIGSNAVMDESEISASAVIVAAENIDHHVGTVGDKYFAGLADSDVSDNSCRHYQMTCVCTCQNPRNLTWLSF